MKKILLLALCCLMVISSCAFTAVADSKPVKLSVMIARDSINYDYNPQTNLAYAKILEATGVELEIDRVEDIVQAVNMSMASGEVSDIVVTPKFTFLEYVNTGYLMELDELLEKYGQDIVANISQKAWDYVTVAGSIYAIPQENLNSKYITGIRKDWVEKLGFEVKETYTLSEFTDILTAFAEKDPDDNGENDTYGFNSAGGSWDISAMQIFGAFGGQPNQNYLNADGNFYAFNTSDEFRAALEYLHDLWVKKVIDPEFFVAAGDQAKQKAVNNRIGMVSGWWSTVRDLLTNGFTTINPDGEFARVYVTSDDGNTWGMVDNGLITNTCFISATCEHPEAAMKLLNFLHTDEGYALNHYGIEGVHYERDEDGRVTNIFAAEKDWIGLVLLSRRLDEVIFNDALQLGPDATKDDLMNYPFQMIQYTTGLSLYSDAFYGLPVPDESIEYANELANFVTSKVVEFVTGETPINDESWAMYKTEWASKGGKKILSAYAKTYNDMYGTKYGIAQ